MDYPPTKCPESPRILIKKKKRAPRAPNGPNHLGLCARRWAELNCKDADMVLVPAISHVVIATVTGVWVAPETRLSFC